MTRSFSIVLVASPLVWLLAMSAFAGTPSTLDASRFQQLDVVIEEAIAQHRLPGAVVYVGVDDSAVYRKAYGQRALKPEPVVMTPDTVFDLASLSKPIGCSTSIVILVDRGKLALTDKVAKYIPEFGNNGKESITIEQLLLHRGGLVPDNPITDFDNGGPAGLAAIYRSKPQVEPNTRFIYSDVGYIVLGEVVKAVDGRPLDRFAHDEIFEPLGMNETSYNPPASLRARAAPTEMRNGEWIVGQVHDPRSFAMGGVSGHAGLFSTANDLSRFCRMILHHGALDGKRILSEKLVKTWTAVHYLPDGPDGVAGRTYGFDADTAYSSPRGERFKKGETFGHTGFTGTSFWIDPKHDCFVILLSHSVHPDGKGNVIGLRRKVATIAAEALLGPAPATAGAPKPAAISPATAPTKSPAGR